MSLFLKDPNEGNAFELQTMWYEIAMGNAYIRKKDYPAGMRMYKFIEKSFSDIYEDQFDFHVYSIRKFGLKTYIEMIKYEDEVHNNKLYVKSASYMIKSLIKYIDIKKL